MEVKKFIGGENDMAQGSQGLDSGIRWFCGGGLEGESSAFEDRKGRRFKIKVFAVLLPGRFVLITLN